MRYDSEWIANARIVTADELATLVDAAAPVRPEHSGFELPGWMWGAMFAGYATFFAGVLAATAGGAKAAFAIAISVLYTSMFFGTARLLARIDAREVRAFTRSGGKLRTWTGPMDVRSVAGQVLAIPAILGFFGVAISIIAAIVI